MRRYRSRQDAAPREVLARLDITGQVLRFEVGDSTGGNVGAVEIRVFAPPG